jgi:hypothetical protein
MDATLALEALSFPWLWFLPGSRICTGPGMIAGQLDTHLRQRHNGLENEEEKKKKRKPSFL